MRFVARCAVGLAVMTLFVCAAWSRPARAFGGLWSAEGSRVDAAGVQAIVIDNPDETLTVIVRLMYEGPARDFVWLIPVPNMPTLELSSNTVFERLEAATAPGCWVGVAVEGSCAEQPDAGADPVGYPEPSAPPLAATTAEPAGAVSAGTAGPYAYAVIEPDPTLEAPAEVALEWLADNGYTKGRLDVAMLDSYLRDGFRLLAVKFTASADAGAMRPLAMTYQSDELSLPLRPLAAAAAADIPVQLWLVGSAQAVPENYKALVLNDALYDWLSCRRHRAGTLPGGGVSVFGGYVGPPANYDAVVSAAADEADGRGFVTELGGPASQHRQLLWGPQDDGAFEVLSTQRYADGIAALLEASAQYGRWDGFREAVAGATTRPQELTVDALLEDPGAYGDVVEVDTARLFERIESDVIAPVARAAALLYGGPYLTRLYTRLDAGELTRDPIFTYNADLAQVSNVHVARQIIECDPDLDIDEAPWRFELPQGGVVGGDAGDGWPLAVGSLPANLKIVTLSTSGPGSVDEDNSELIAMRLFDDADRTSGLPRPQPARHGVVIGGSQTVRPPYRPPAEVQAVLSSRNPHSDGCTVVRGGGRSPWAAGCVLAIAIALLRRRRRQRAALALCALLSACSSSDDPSAADAGDPGTVMGALTPEQARDPENCKGCHPVHYREWSASMHAYAAQDPVFIAMNRRGQRETDGQLGTFCIQCHAPMAVVDGLSEDGLNIEELPDFDRGVSCYFCHNVVEVVDDHNAKLRLANDTTMRGPIDDPFPSPAHQAEFSEIFNGTSRASVGMCGGCHDIVTPNGVHLERTFQEYQSGIFAQTADGDEAPFDTCGGCHMPPSRGLAAVAPAGTSERTLHEHLWPGIDVALTPFPHRDAMRKAVEDCQLGLSVTFFTLEVTPPDLFTFQLETAAGHHTPSGAAQDRRMWIEFLAYDADGNLLEDVSSGNIADDEIADKPQGDPGHDPQLALFRDRIYDAEGKPVHMFWEAEKSPAHPYGYESAALPVATTTYVEGRHAIVKQYRASGPDGLPARVTARLRMRPIGLDVLHDLVESGDLDPAIVEEMPTFTFGARIEWTPEDGLTKTIAAQPEADCTTYRCMLDPAADGCP